uniref:hypothetical protein n=1 Tax=Limnohabitans sp. TaxID=1907725 RepID=UPI002B00329D
MDNEEFNFLTRSDPLADEDDFEDLFGEHLGTPERREINTDEHGQVISSTPVKSRRLVTQQKTSLAVAERREVRTRFKNVVLWDDRDKRSYKEDDFSGMLGWYLWISHDGKETDVASIYVFKNLAQRGPLDPYYVEFLHSIPEYVKLGSEGNLEFYEADDGVTVLKLEDFLPYMCYPYDLQQDKNLWKHCAHWMADGTRAANFINALMLRDVTRYFPDTKTFDTDFIQGIELENEMFANRVAITRDQLVKLGSMWSRGDLSWGQVPEKKYNHVKKVYDLNLVIIDKINLRNLKNIL